MIRSAHFLAAALAGLFFSIAIPARAQEEPAAPAAPAAPVVAPAQGVALPTAAQPQSAASSSTCDRDFQSLANARTAQIGSLNRLTKAKGGKMNPIDACGKLQGLAGIEARMVAYVEKNKDWCSIPDNVLDNIKKGRQGTLAFAGKACSAAGLYKKALAQNAAQQRAAASGAGPAAQNAPQAQRLPAGPL